VLDVYTSFAAGTIARRSRPELGLSGLAAREGFVSPEAMVQKVFGSSRGDATKFVQVGTLIGVTEAALAVADAAALEQVRQQHQLDLLGFDRRDAVETGAGGDVAPLVGVPWQTPIVRAVTAGALTPTAADALVRGLGTVDQAVTATKLAAALDTLLAEVPGMTAEQAFKRARRMRDLLDEAGIRDREKQARDDTRWKMWRREDGMVILNALLPPEQGETWMSAYDALTSPRRGGCRWPDCDYPRSFTEAHHLQEWFAQDGRTDLAWAVLLCRRHHLLLHNNHWLVLLNPNAAGESTASNKRAALSASGQTTSATDLYFLRPPTGIDPHHTLIALRSKSTPILDHHAHLGRSHGGFR
jgi:hypothetical protein